MEILVPITVSLFLTIYGILTVFLRKDHHQAHGAVGGCDNLYIVALTWLLLMADQCSVGYWELLVSLKGQ